MRLRVSGGLLQPAAPALVAGLSLADGLRAIAGRYLTLSLLYEIGAPPVITGISLEEQEVRVRLDEGEEAHYGFDELDELTIPTPSAFIAVRAASIPVS